MFQPLPGGFHLQNPALHVLHERQNLVHRPAVLPLQLLNCGQTVFDLFEARRIRFHPPQVITQRIRHILNRNQRRLQSLSHRNHRLINPPQLIQFLRSRPQNTPGRFRSLVQSFPGRPRRFQ